MNRAVALMREAGWNREDVRASRNLSDLCSDIFLLNLQLCLTDDYGDAETLRRRVAELLRALDSEGKRLRISQEDLDNTRYVLAALIDETILNSRWAHRDLWANRPLQLEYFGDALAGETFFDQLDQLRRRPDKAQLLEVYYLCLLLGFRGKFKHEDTSFIRGAFGLSEKDILRISGRRADRLSFDWEIADDPIEDVAPKKRSVPWKLVVAGSLGLALLIYLALWFMINSSLSQALEQLNLLMD